MTNKLAKLYNHAAHIVTRYAGQWEVQRRDIQSKQNLTDWMVIHFENSQFLKQFIQESNLESLYQVDPLSYKRRGVSQGNFILPVSGDVSMTMNHKTKHSGLG